MTNLIHDEHPSIDRSVSVRMILQALILAGVLWMASSIQSQNASIVKLQVQMDNLQTSLAGIPDLNTRITKLEMQETEEERRTQALESFRREAVPTVEKLKGFVR